MPGDTSHYGTYDITFNYTVKDGVLIAVDMDSAGSSWGGKWGTLANKSYYVTGYLPTGVSSTTSCTTDADGNYVISNIGLSGAKQYDTKSTGTGYAIQSIAIYSADSNGTVNEYVLDEDGNIVYDKVLDESDGDYDDVARKNAVTVSTSLDSTDSDYVTCDAEAGTITIAAGSGFNLVKIGYKIGSCNYYYQYTACDENAAKYDVEITDIAMEPSGIPEKNRNQFSLVPYVAIMQQLLAGFVSGEIDDIDTVTAATKSSSAIVESIYATQGYYYPLANVGVNTTDSVTPVLSESLSQLFTSVSEDLEITCGGVSVKDTTEATVDAEGNVVLVSGYDYAGGTGAYGQGVAGISLYSLDGELTTFEAYTLGTKNYATFSDVASVDGCLAAAESGSTVSNGYHADMASCDITDADGNVLAVWDADARTVTVLSSEVTHVCINYVMAKKTTTGSTLGTVYSVAAAQTAAEVVIAAASIDADDEAAVADFAANFAQLSEEEQALAGEYTAVTALVKLAAAQAELATVKAELAAAKAVVSQELSVKAKASVKAGKTVKIAVKGAKGKLVASCAKSGVKVSVKGSKIVVKAKKKGTYKVKVYAKATSKCAKSVTKTITVKVK